MKNILVFPCGTEIGLEINRSLKDTKHFRLFGASSVDDHGKYVYSNYINGIPFVDDKSFISEINKIIDENKIDFIIPAHDSVVLKMAECQAELHATVVTSPAETCRICRSKRETYRVFDGLIPVPRIVDIEKNAEFPIFLKPDVGQGSKGTYKARNKEEALFYSKLNPELIALEYLPGKEYTVDCFTNVNGELLFAEGRERKRINNGISVNSVKCDNSKFKELALRINATLSFRGVWFYQVKERSDGELVLLEIAPRIAGTMALFRVEGVNFIQLSLFDRMGIHVDILYNSLDVQIDRALHSVFASNLDYDCVYVDFDDTVIIKDRVNTDLIKFLYQVKNSKKMLILITKHVNDIQKTLVKYCISQLLFDEIIQIEKDEKKSAFIKRPRAILIDDSFKERMEVSAALSIPVFDVDAVELLLNYRE